MTARIIVRLGAVMAAVGVLIGCARPPDQVARIDTRLASYLGEAAGPATVEGAARHVGVGVLPKGPAATQDETTRLALIAAVREALTGPAARAGGVDSVRPLADSYLREGGLEEVRSAGRLFGVDTVVLVSLDQSFRPADGSGPVAIAAAGGETIHEIGAQTLLTVIDIAVIRLDNGKTVFSEQVLTTLGVDARTWDAPRLRRAAQDQGVVRAINALRQRLDTRLARVITAT